MGFLKSFLARMRPLSRSLNPNPGHEDVESSWLNVGGVQESGSYDDAGEMSSEPEAGAARSKQGMRESKIEPEFAGTRPPAAIRVPESELRAIETGHWDAEQGERDQLLQQLNELGYNLKRVLGNVCQMQEVIASDFDSLSEDDKNEARAYINGLSALVINHSPAQRAA